MKDLKLTIDNFDQDNPAPIMNNLIKSFQHSRVFCPPAFSGILSSSKLFPSRYKQTSKALLQYRQYSLKTQSVGSSPITQSSCFDSMS